MIRVSKFKSISVLLLLMGLSLWSLASGKANEANTANGSLGTKISVVDINNDQAQTEGKDKKEGNIQTVKKTFDKRDIVNQLSAPSYFNFSPQIKTIGQAITQVLEATGLHLSDHLSPYILDVLNQPLPERLRSLNAMSVFKAIKTLTGAQIFVITPTVNEISFSFDKTLSDSDLTIKTIESPLQQYLDRANYTVRVSTPLIESGISEKPTRDEVIGFNRQKTLYFGFNNQDHITGIAESQKEADSLAQKKRAVFYALQGQSLKQTIMRWGDDTGFKVYYLAKKDLIIDSPSVFFGGLKSKTGALAQLLQAASLAGVNAKAVFNINQVLVIKDNTYSPLFLNGETHA